MKKPNVFFFYSKDKEKVFVQDLSSRYKLACYEFEAPIPRESYTPQDVVVIIYDSTKAEKGIDTLKKVRDILPDCPIIIVAKDPGKEYFKAALENKVSKLFSFPLNQEQFLSTVHSIVATQRKIFGFGSVKTWWKSMLHQTQLRFASLFSSKAPTDTVGPKERYGIAHQSMLPIIGKEWKQENTYDISVLFFGQLSIKIRGKTVSIAQGNKNSTILAYLLFHHHKSIHRDVLINRFWESVNTSAAKNSLHVAIHSIRKNLAKVLPDQEVILYENESYCINPELDIVTDVEKFTYYWNKGRAIEEEQGLKSALAAYNKAVGIYKLDFLENLRFEDWCETERGNLKEVYLFILNRLSAFFFEEKSYYACINVCNKMLEKDECLEATHRKVMRCYYALGMTDLATRQYFKCKKILAEELELQPSKQTVSLLEKIQEGVVLS